MTDSIETPGTPEPQKAGFFDTWLNLYFAPRQAFQAIVARPTVLVPLILIIVLTLAFTGIWSSHIEADEFMKMQMQESGQWDKMGPDQRSAALNFGGKIFAFQLWVGAPIMQIIWFLLTTLYFLFAARFLYGSRAGFKTLLSVNLWSNFAIAALTTPLMLMTYYLKGDWYVNPQEVFQASPAAFLEKADTARWLWALAGSLDLMSFWLIALLSIGLGVAMQRKATSAAWPVIIGWIILVGIKILFSMLGGAGA